MEEFKSFFKTVGGNEGSRCHYSTRLDTYGKGCNHDCSYCYAKSLLDFRKLWNPEHPAVADIDQIEKTIKRVADGKVKGVDPTVPLRLGGMTDCFMPIEKNVRNTYRTIRLLNKYMVPYIIVTKGAIVADDEYVKLFNPRLAHIQVSVTTTDDDLCKTYEKASAPSQRIKAIERLQSEGLDVQLRLSPYIPEYIDFDILNGVKCDKILVEFLRVNHWIKQWFDIDYSDYTLKHGGYLQLPLEKKIEYLSRITGFKEVSVCEDVDEHWEYWKNNVNKNPEDCCNLRV